MAFLLAAFGHCRGGMEAGGEGRSADVDRRMRQHPSPQPTCSCRHRRPKGEAGGVRGCGVEILVEAGGGGDAGRWEEND